MKRLFALLMAMVMVFGLVACGGKTEAPAETKAPEAAAPAETEAAVVTEAAPAVEALTFKVAYAETEDSIFGQVINAAFADITEKTEGRLVFEIYPGNQLGSITDVLEQQVAGAPLICSMGFDNLGDTVPDFAPASFPYVFNDLYEVQALAKSDWIANIEQQLVAKDIQPLCYGAIGYRHFISTFEINTAADCAGHIMRMGPSGAAQGFITVMDGTPTTSTWADNYSLLQTGVIESCEAPLSLLLSSSLGEVCDYLALSGHFVNPFSLTMNPIFWNQISAEDQAIVKDTLAAACVEMADQAMEMEHERCGCRPDDPGLSPQPGAAHALGPVQGLRLRCNRIHQPFFRKGCRGNSHSAALRIFYDLIEDLQ